MSVTTIFALLWPILALITLSFTVDETLRKIVIFVFVLSLLNALFVVFV